MIAALVLNAAHPLARPGGVAPDAVSVVIDTPVGTIAIAVDAVHAPRTAANFLRYVEAGKYDGGRFLRTVRPGTDTNPAAPVAFIEASRAPEASDYPPIPLERTPLRHRDGAVALARSGAGVVTSDFYICVGDDPSLDSTGRRARQGGVVFGRVTAGMDVVRQIQALPIFPGTQALIRPVSITRITRLGTPAEAGAPAGRRWLVPVHGDVRGSR